MRIFFSKMLNFFTNLDLEEQQRQKKTHLAWGPYTYTPFVYQSCYPSIDLSICLPIYNLPSCPGMKVQASAPALYVQMHTSESKKNWQN